MMAVESDKVTADVIEAGEFPDLAQRYRVTGVPKTIINEEISLLGGQPEARFVQQVVASGLPPA